MLGFNFKPARVYISTRLLTLGKILFNFVGAKQMGAIRAKKAFCSSTSTPEIVFFTIQTKSFKINLVFVVALPWEVVATTASSRALADNSVCFELYVQQTRAKFNGN